MIKNDKNLTIVPLYINCNKWKEDFNKVENWFKCNNSSCVLAIGDCNARVSNNQTVSEGAVQSTNNIRGERKSKDKIINSKGSKLLEMLNENEMIIINGTSKGDKEGEFTFIHKLGSSVIDLCCLSLDYINMIKDFRVGSELFVRGVVEDERDLALLPKLVWTKMDEEQFRIKLENVFKDNPINPWEVEKSIEQFNKNIRQAAHHGKEISDTVSRKIKQVWFDRECEAARKKSFAFLNLYRKNNCETMKRLYLLNNKKYKEVCNDKKIKYLQTLTEKLSMVKNSVDFWDIIKLFKGNTKIGIEIKITDLAQYFYKLLNSSNRSL